MLKGSTWDPKVAVDPTADEFFHKFVSPQRSMRQAAESITICQVDFELNNRCAGSCDYCFSSSTSGGEIMFPTDRALHIIDDLYEMGVRQLTWPGGDPLLHPDCFNIWRYAGEKGIRNFVWSSVATITPKVARQVVEEESIRMMGIHIDTIDQATYNKVHRDPRTLPRKIQGFKNLLDAGYSPKRIFGCICLTRPAVETIEQTLDWFIDEMGVKFIDMPIFRPLGLGKDAEKLKIWEPSAEDVQRACEYRAKKLGASFLRIGPMECSKFFCQSYFLITSEGNVLCCGNIPDLVFGNVHQESVREIYERNRERLLFAFEVKGKCGNCENNDVCFGCRANAFYYAGDIQASDPKCWMNEPAPNSLEF